MNLESLLEFIDKLKFFEAYDLTIIVIGLGILGLATLLHRLEKRSFSFPILLLIFGYVVFALPLGLTPPDPQSQGAITLHLTEIGVIISLMGVGLKIGRIPNWRTWSSAWRMLGICMPLTIVSVALLGWWMLGLAPAAAILLAAALAPTDPVLASDIQVGAPEVEAPKDAKPNNVEEKSEDKEDEFRFALTAEAGLNDSLAFPFTYLALLMLTYGNSPANWLTEWLLIDVAYRMIVGIGAGVLLGWGLSLILLRLPVDSEPDKMKAGVGILAGTLLLYGVTECIGGYGFLAVFIGGLTIKHREETQQSHQSMHTFAEQSEQLFMTGILLALGGAIAGGLLTSLTWQAALLGVLIIFVIRPVAGMIALIGERRLSFTDRWIASFFGIRGIGCLYYLAYGVQKGDFAQEGLLWATCAFTVALSVVIHGILATPLIRLRNQRNSEQASNGLVSNH